MTTPPEHRGPRPSRVEVSGSGSASATPDVVRVSLGIRCDSEGVAAALSAAAATVRKVSAAARSHGLADRDIASISASVQPRWNNDGSAVAGYFLSRGWRHVGVATADDQRAMQRHAGFASAVGRSVPTAIVKAPSTVRAGRTALAELLRQDPALEAVHCSSDALAAGVLIEARTRGIAVPQQLAVCGFGDADFAECQEPSLTTVRIAGADIGRRAAEMVIARGQGREVAERIVDVGFSIVERGSTASR
jgi:DNA-binding LacI/PurR family transcriptional regulator